MWSWIENVTFNKPYSLISIVIIWSVEWIMCTAVYRHIEIYSFFSIFIQKKTKEKRLKQNWNRFVVLQMQYSLIYWFWFSCSFYFIFCRARRLFIIMIIFCWITKYQNFDHKEYTYIHINMQLYATNDFFFVNKQTIVCTISIKYK